MAPGPEGDLGDGGRVAARGGGEAVGRELAEVLEVVAVDRLERVGDRAVEADAPGEAQLLVDGLAHEGVGEPEAARPCAVLAQELRPRGLLDGVEHVDPGERVEPLEEPDVEVAPHDRGRLQHAVRAVPQARQAAAEDLADALGDPGVRARLAQVQDHLLDEERVARGLLAQPRGEIVAAVLAEAVADERGDVVRAEAGERDALVQALAAQVAERRGERVRARQLALAVGADDEQRRGARRADEVGEQQQRAAIGPVQVVEGEDDRAAAAPQRGVDGLEQPPPRAGRVVPRRRRVGPRRAEGLDEGLVGRDRLLEAAAGADRRAGAVGPRAQLGHEAGLADPRLAADEDEPPLAGPGAFVGGLEAGERGGAADERARVRAADDRGDVRDRPGGRRIGLGRAPGGRDRRGARVGVGRADGRDQRAGLGRRRDPEVRAQPLAQALGGGERGGAITCGRQATDEGPPTLLGERLQAGGRAAQAEGRGPIARRLGAGGERLEPRRDPLALLVARGEHPVGLEPGEQRAGAEGERVVGPAVGEQRVRLAGIDPGRLERDRVAVGDEAVARRAERAARLVEGRAQARAGAGVEDVGPEPRGDRGAAVAAGMQREPREELAGPAAGRRVEARPVALEREAPEHADAEHGDATLTLR